MINKYLLLKKNQTCRKVQIVDEVPLTLQGEQYRISPIYPVLPEAYHLPTAHSKYNIFFLFSSYAYTKIGAILNKTPKETHSKLWFSHGLASILYIDEHDDLLVGIRDILGSDIHAYEHWEIEDEKLHVKDYQLFAEEIIDKDSYEILDYSDLEIDYRNILDEFYHCINAAIAKAAQYCPSQLFGFKQLVKTINFIIEELKYLSGNTSEKPKKLSQSKADELKSDTAKKKKRYHFLSSQLVQINSSISYIISQGFSGTVPILENTCPVRTYSLLGIGSAYYALSVFSRHVEKTFSQHPVAKTIREQYGTSLAPEAYTNLRVYKPKEWKKTEFGIDAHLQQSDSTKEKPKLVYYSGRQGFRETKFSISVPINILECSATCRWSLMTLSHELMHAHVMSVLAALFGDENTDSEKHYHKIGKKFSRYRRIKESGGSYNNLNLKDCIRFIILNYCCFAQALKDSTRSGGKLRITLKDVPPENVATLLAENFNEINEIIVHVLDYIYFYNRKNDIYIALLWESWAPVPIVIEKLTSYLLRSLLVLGTQKDGIPSKRYKGAVTELKSILIAIKKKNPGNIVIAKAIETLRQDSDPGGKLFFKFMVGIYLADMANRFLASKHINGVLLNDELREVEEDGSSYFYRLNLGDFEEVHIQSPVAFCGGLLRDVLNKETVSKFESSWASAWTFLACSSYKS